MIHDTPRRNYMLAFMSFLLVAIASVFFFVSYERPKIHHDAGTMLNGNELLLSIARTREEIVQGLSGTPSMGENEGMLFLMPVSETQTFWMKDMHFALDIVFLDKGLVVDIVTLPAPTSSFSIPTYQSKEPADMVLELTEGGATRYGLTMGTRTELEQFRD